MNRTPTNDPRSAVREHRRTAVGGDSEHPQRHRSHLRGAARNRGLDGVLGDQRIDWVALERLRPHARNPRTHSDKQISQIAASIQRFGFVNPVLVDATGGIIAGHGRVEAAKRLGLERVPTLRIDHLSEAEKRAYVIADNRLAELAGWDRELLALELQGLLELELDFDLEIIGFETVEIDNILEGQAGDISAKDDTVPEQPEGLSPISVAGDLWALGPHRLLCGDARNAAHYERLLGTNRAQMVFTDPPYNVAIDGHVCGTGAVKHRDFMMASGEMTQAEFTGFLTGVLGHLATFSADGSIHFICMDWRHMGELLAAGTRSYTELKNLCVWSKDNAGLGSFYRSQHELVFVFKNGRGRHINNFGLGEGGRYRTNIWRYPGVNTLRRGRLEELAMHPTVKPVALVMDAIRDCSRRRGVVLDPFAGSGTTIIATAKTGRVAHAMELDPTYVDVAIRRWQTWSGERAVHTATGRVFDEIAEERRRAPDTASIPPRIRRREGRPGHDR